MNKTIKIISALLIVLVLTIFVNQVVLGTVNYDDIIKNVDSQGDSANVDTSGVSKTAAKVIKAIRNIAAIAAVVILTILGVKYMVGSTEEKAEYKKSFIPLIVGIVVVVSAASIASAIFSVAG